MLRIWYLKFICKIRGHVETFIDEDGYIIPFYECSRCYKYLRPLEDGYTATFAWITQFDPAGPKSDEL